ncbi:MAG: MBOAT family O-acyltransferase [Pseudomonadota bacterium]
MLFSSYLFLLGFLPLALAGFYGLRALAGFRASVSFLLIASLLFYACWSLSHLFLLCGSIALNFLIGKVAATGPQAVIRRGAVILGVVANLTAIFWFKYLDFAGGNITALLNSEWRLLGFLLPLGISFFTFQQIAYLVDCYTSRSYESRFRDYALFVSFFPQLIAGPIVHHKHTRPQFASLNRKPIDQTMLAYGVMIFALGLAKKTMIADPIARAIDPIYAAAAMGDPLSMAAGWTAAIGYTLQIYFDFSGYCDMAIGLGLMFGVRLPINFNSPYKARSIIEFWRRWHITLSNFLRDYVYIPLGGNRSGELMRLRNIFLTMLIGGIWHGAAWTFVIWGAIHATFITANHAARIYFPRLDAWRSFSGLLTKQFMTLAIVILAWVFFRAESIPAAFAVFSSMAGAADASPVLIAHPAAYGLMAFAALIALFAPNSLQITGYTDRLDQTLPKLPAIDGRIMRPTPLAAMSIAVMLTAGVMAAWQPAIFIYFNF